MALSTAYSWIFSIILLNNGIITVNSFPHSIEGLVEFGLDLLLDYVLNNDKEEIEEVTMTDIASKIDDIENTVKNSATNVINEVGHILRYEQAMRDFTRDVSYISTLYDWFKEFSNGSERITLDDYADVCLTAADNGLKHRLKSVMHLISPYEESEATPLFNLIIGRYRDSEFAAARCNKWLSVQQEIYRMYGDIVLYLIKGYTMVINAYEIKGKVGYKRFRTEKNDTKTSYKKAMRELTKSAVAAMREAPRDIRGCDPGIWEEGESYIELKWLFSGYFIPEYDLSESFSCVLKCGAYSGIAGWSLRERQKDTEWPPCRGYLYNCSYSSMRFACAGAKPWRFYDAVGGPEANLAQCSKKRLVPEHREGQARSKYWGFRHCDMCFCTCDSITDINTIRHFSLKVVQSRTIENKVITGLRFVVIRRCIYIQIQEGKLEPNGYINQSTVKWQPVKIHKGDKWRVTLKDKTIHLGTINFPTGYVMTGVKFKEAVHALKLGVGVDQFDYSSGILANKVRKWTFFPETNRKQIKIEAPDIPTKAKTENIVTLEDNGSVDFRMTDVEKDIAQTTVPFLDAQIVKSVPPRPLSGLGLYYKGQEGYGGFIALKLVAYDYAEVLAQKGPSIPELVEGDAKKETGNAKGESPKKRRRTHSRTLKKEGR